MQQVARVELSRIGGSVYVLGKGERTGDRIEFPLVLNSAFPQDSGARVSFVSCSLTPRAYFGRDLVSHYDGDSLIHNVPLKDYAF